jgi:hypothetical protein
MSQAEVLLRDLEASAANSSRPNAVPPMPHPPSAASVRRTQVRWACDGSPQMLARMAVTLLTSCFWPSLVFAHARPAVFAEPLFLTLCA